jgi:nucleoside diphosphate kinase
MIKPEGVRDRVVGRIIQRFEDKGLKVNYAFIYFTMYFLTFSTSVECD